MKRCWILCFCLLFSGCFLSEPPTPPVDIPTQWPKDSHLNPTVTGDLAQFMWWRQFKNAELNTLIEKALQQNPLSKTALANIELAQSQLEEVKLNWLPSMSMLAGFSQFPILGNPGTTVIAYPQYIVNILQLYKQQQSAKARYAASIYAKDCANLVIISQTALAYFSLLADIEALRLSQQLLQNTQHYLKIAQSQYYSGLQNQDAIPEISSQLKQLQAQIALLKHNVVVSKNALHYLLDENPGDIRVKTSFQAINSSGVIPSHLPVCVLNNRPDISQSRALLRATSAEVSSAAADLLPSINLGAYLGHGTSVGAIQLGEAYLSNPIVDLPLFAKISGKKAEAKAQYIHYVDVIRSALRDVANDLSAYTSYNEALNNQLSALKDKRHYCELAAKRYQHGIDDNKAVIYCQIELNQLELLVNQTKLKKMIALVTLYENFGGGYHGT